jgi:hypothetical protein
MAKVCVFSLKNCTSNDREFDGLLYRCNLNERQMDKIRKTIEQGESDAMSSYAGNSRYGASMRGSSLDSRGGQGQMQRSTPYVPSNIIKNHAAGSDGFSQSSF